MKYVLNNYGFPENGCNFRYEIFRIDKQLQAFLILRQIRRKSR